MESASRLIDRLGGEAGCQRLSANFYARVATDSELRPLFPGKSLRCATEEFASFLIQFLGGDEAQTQHRWWLSLRESHARFQITPAQRSAWLKHMTMTLDAAPIGEETRVELRQFFEQSSSYTVGADAKAVDQGELSTRWDAQRALDDAITAIAANNDDQVLALAPQFAHRPSVFVGLLARMMRSGRPAQLQFIADAIARDPSLIQARFTGRTLLHYASAAGRAALVSQLLRLGADPSVEDHSGHTPLYRVANECATSAGPEIVRILVQAGADVNSHGGVTYATPLHMAARRGFVALAQALLDCGAASNLRDRKGDTPLQRAINCRKIAVADLLRNHVGTR